MIVSLERYSINVTQCLHRAGYTKFYNTYVRPIEPGVRFHAKPIGNKEFDLHVDIYTDDTHFAPHMPETIGKEAKRIKKAIRYATKPSEKVDLRLNVTKKQLKKGYLTVHSYGTENIKTK